MSDPITLQISALGFGIVGLFVLVLAVVTVWQMVRFMDAYDEQALTVFGEYRGLLEPGINFSPPFVSYRKPSRRFDRRPSMRVSPLQVSDSGWMMSLKKRRTATRC